jgi:hypothetical protein
MKNFQVEVTATKNGQQVWTCTHILASSEKAAINKAIKLSKSEGYTDQHSIKAFQQKPCRYAEALPF